MNFFQIFLIVGLCLLSFTIKAWAQATSLDTRTAEQERQELGADVKEVELSLAWLAEQDFISVSKRRFLITTKGIEFLESDDSPPEESSPVPRRPSPTSGQAEASTPLPDLKAGEEECSSL